MIPRSITDYLTRNGVPFHPVRHPRFEHARELADHLDVEDDQIAKVRLLLVDGKNWLAMLPSYGDLDIDKVAQELDATEVRELPLEELAAVMPDCEPGAEPPFASLYGLPLIMDEGFTETDEVLVRGGTFEDAIELRVSDLREREQPNIAPIAAEIPHTTIVHDHMPTGAGLEGVKS